MSRRKISPFAIMTISFFAMLLAWYPCFGEDNIVKDNLSCLKCHGEKGQKKTFQDGTSVSIYVNENDFSFSVHGTLSCSTCHSDFSGGAHEERLFRSKEQYRIKASRACRSCHENKSIASVSIHESLLIEEKKGKSPICTDCHSAHSVTAISGGKIFASEERYCMGCHGHDISMKFRSGETLNLKMDVTLINNSAHKNLSCSDCHFGFSSESHVVRSFKSKRDYSLAASSACRRCHFDKYTKTAESIHFTLLSSGNLKAPTCTDCHNAHATEFAKNNRITSANKCRKCHNDIYTEYSKSVHGASLLSNNNTDVPSCVNCHTAHDIVNPLAKEYHEKIPEMCGNCHSNKTIMGKYGLSTDVVKTYLSDFHGVTLDFYRHNLSSPGSRTRPIALCTDCHGTHNITSTVGPDSTIVKKNLISTCRKCHTEANENFPDIWLSHYTPSLSNAPLVFIVNSAYKVLLPVMLIGLMLQIFLHVWRYLVNR